jgi:16S rRNA (uracil1498-N3)-methyltransferase
LPDAAPAWLALEALPAVGGSIEFGEDDAHYLRRVCRVRAGERITATDGTGGVAEVRIAGAGRELTGTVERRETRERGPEAWVLCGAPEGERADWLIEKLAELGLAVFQPLDCERGRWDRAGRKFERWQRLASAALRQSRQAFRMSVRTPLPLAEALARVERTGSRWLADPAGRPAGSLAPPASPVVGAIGPSGGFSEAEWAALTAAGFEPISLSRSRLRTETAAIAWGAWWAAGSA